jgi:hypothetical protein
MYLFILGGIVIAGLLAYLYFTRDEAEEITAETVKPAEPKEEGPAKVIDLPNDIEKEKRKRNIKTGK